MEIPVAIFKDEGSVYGVNVPDIRGCHSWGDTIDEALKNAKEAIYSHVETLVELGAPVEIAQSRIEVLAQQAEYAGAVWALVNVELEKLDSKPERINISIPRFVLSKIDDFAASRHETRSGVISRAALQLIAAETKALAVAG
ncbi:HicB family protein [Janthinobacterium sp. BJB412]|nr:HicB family protein [Janthinobacterium sp. BJB412]